MKLFKKLTVLTMSISMCVSLLAPTVLLADGSDPCGCAAAYNLATTIAGNNYNNCNTTAANNYAALGLGCLLLIVPILVAGCEGAALVTYNAMLSNCSNQYDTDIANAQAAYDSCNQNCNAG